MTIDATAGAGAGAGAARLPDPRRIRSLRIRAILAGGLVLGIGTAVTLASWNDSEFATGTFTAGSFNLVGSTDGTTYTDHASTANAATLGFTVNPTALSPGDTVYAPFAVELAAGTTNSGTVTVTNAATSGSVANLTYTLIQPTAFGCSAATTGTALVPAATAVGTVPGGVTFAVARGTGGAAGAPVFLCFKVTAAATLVAGQTGSSTWQFQAIST